MMEHEKHVPSSSSPPSWGLHQILLLIVTGLAFASLVLIQSTSSSTINPMATEERKDSIAFGDIDIGSNNETLNELLHNLSLTMESYEAKLKAMQERLDRMDQGGRNPSAGIESPVPMPGSPHPVTALLQQQTKILCCSIGDFQHGGAGLGSLINRMLYVSSYQRITQGRQLVIDESDLTIYRKNSTQGLISGYFDTTFPVVSNKQEYEQIQQEAGIDLGALGGTSTSEDEASDGQKNILRVVIDDGADEEASFATSREQAKAFYSDITNANPSPNKVHQFHILTLELCNQFTINEETQQAIDDLFWQASVPDFAALNEGSNATTSPITVAFHIQPRDKLYGVHPTPASAYVAKLEQVLEHNNIPSEDVQHCFVATEDYEAFLEVQEALAHSSISHCHIHTLASSKMEEDHNSNDLVSVLAFMKPMVDATFFLGSFSSDIGALVPLLRGCNHPSILGKALPPMGQEYQVLSEQEVASQLDHYFHSYGVQSLHDFSSTEWKEDDWFMPSAS